MSLDRFHPAVAAWFQGQFEVPTEPQEQGWPAILDGKHTLIAAPTGSGKTLAAFLAAIDGLVRQALDGGLEDETHVVYVSPLKALSNDIQKNLQEPLAGIGEKLRAMGLLEIEIRTLVRTGDTPQYERTKMVKRPPHILVTTPESLYILLTSEGGRGILETAHTVIVDEIHAIADDKRGSHLSLSLERLDALAERPLVRIGLSATQRPIAKVARFLTGTGGNEVLDETGESAGAQGAEESPPRRRAASDLAGSAVADIEDTSGPGAGLGWPGCTIIDAGHQRELDLTIELTETPLEAVMSGETWEEIYDRLAEFIGEHRTTLIFVNTRRMAERAARHLSERIGEENITAHHGSLAREQRLDAEQRLKSGDLQALVATASLELGIDIGSVDLVCQIGSTRAIATLLQRVGRSGHSLSGIPKGRLFPMSRDELVECVALVDAVRRGELDSLIVPEGPLDILAQQIVAAVAAEEWQEDNLYELMRRAYPFRKLSRDDFQAVVRMLADGFTTRRGRRGAHIHHDEVNGRLRPRRGARLSAITSGGAIPDVADYYVVLEPEGAFIGTLDEDFAIESLPGDIFQLGNLSYRIRRIEQGRVRVEDAHGEPPNIPFWAGEAPGRTPELSAAVSRLRKEIGDRLIVAAATAQRPLVDGDVPDEVTDPVFSEVSTGEEGSGEEALPIPDEAAIASVSGWLVDEVGIDRAAAEQVVEYLAAGQAALGAMPTQETLIIERFFDEAGDMHVVVHSPYGSRLNRAWGLSLRKRFCRSFNFELQAAATEDAIVLSLGPTHSFPLADVFKFLHSGSVRDLLIQAMFDAPMFPTRWRWNATRSLAVLRWRGGRRVPPRLQRMDAEDLIAVVFPDQLACLENIAGDREIPDHPLVDQTILDCLEEAMDIGELEALLQRIESGEVELIARDLSEASPLSHETISARPYAYLDDAPLEERRTLAVQTRRWMDPKSAADIGSLDAAAIARVREEAWPEVRDADELHDTLVLLGFLTEAEGMAGQTKDEEIEDGWLPWLRDLAVAGRATVLHPNAVATSRSCAGAGERQDPRAGDSEEPPSPPATHPSALWIATERVPQFEAIFPDSTLEPDVKVPPRLAEQEWSADQALVEIVRGRLEGVGPTTVAELAGTVGVSEAHIDKALVALEAEGFAIRGQFTPGFDGLEWCERRLLARIHRYTLNRLRQEIEPVAARDFMRFLIGWQRLATGERPSGPESLAGVLEQLEGFPAQAAAWESEILPARLEEYDPVWLDALCLAGRLAWGRLPPPGTNGKRSGPIRTTPVTLVGRDALAVWQEFVPRPNLEEARLSASAEAVLAYLAEHGASFFHELVEGTGLLHTQLEDALGELVAWGLLTADSFTGLRALLVPSSRRPPKRGGRRKGSVAIFGVENAGRWSLFWPPDGNKRAEAGGRGTKQSEAGRKRWHRLDPESVEAVARVLLRRYGVVFRRLLEREGVLPPWRELLRVYRRLEARGEIRGGRFVAGFSGEQYALPEAVGALRKARRESLGDGFLSVSGADPLNLIGIITPGDRLPALAANRLLYQDGIPIATLQSSQVNFLIELDPGAQWEAKNALVRRSVPPRLRAYLGRSA